MATQLLALMMSRNTISASAGVFVAGISFLTLSVPSVQAAECFLLSDLNTCSPTIGDFTFSNFSYSGFAASLGDKFVLATGGDGSARVQLDLNPGRTVDGEFGYTIALANGRVFDRARANVSIENSFIIIGLFSTTAFSPALTALAGANSFVNGGLGDWVAFNPDLTSATFQQSFEFSLSARNFAQLASAGLEVTTRENPPVPPVPGPLPIFGAAAAFRLSRRLRSRSKASV